MTRKPCPDCGMIWKHKQDCPQLKAQKHRHGGRRPGAGRKPKPTGTKFVSRLYTLPPDVAAWIDAQPEKERSAIVAAAILGFMTM